LTTESELFAAIDRGDLPAVEHLVAAERGLAAARDDAGVSAIMHALYRGQPAIALALAEAVPALGVFEAAALGRSDRLEELLTSDPALARSVSPDGFTALHYPGFFGEGDAARCAALLVVAGADVNARSANDFSVLPLHSAVAGNHEDVVDVLLAAGAEVNAVQPHGYTPLHGAAQNGADATVGRLLALGADRGLTTDDGRTAADVASEAGHEELAGRLR
jgi:uncharacterized protein